MQNDDRKANAQLRLECLKLAHPRQTDQEDDVLQRVEKYASFVIGTGGG
jgi:hypothetical protein